MSGLQIKLVAEFGRVVSALCYWVSQRYHNNKYMQS